MSGGFLSCFSNLLRLVCKKKPSNQNTTGKCSAEVSDIVEADTWSAKHFSTHMHVEKFIKEYFHIAISVAYPQLSPIPKVLIAPGKETDFQVNNALNLAKVLKRTPIEVAQEILASLPANEIIAESTTDSRGFIQVNVNMKFLSNYVHCLNNFGVSSTPVKQQRVAVDFSSPNIAKEMHVGHLRSTIIGDALCRMYEFCGHEVLRINHIGDWGTQFGMLIAYLKRQYPDHLENPPHISDLSIFYKESKVFFDSDPEFKKEAYAEVVSLQGDETNALKAWRLLCDVSRKEFQEIYDRLDIKLGEYGESFYKDKIPKVLQMCEDAGVITTLADGAKVIMPISKKHFSEITEKDFSFVFLYAFRNFKEETALQEVLKSYGIINADEEINLGKKQTKKVSEIDWQIDAEKVASAAAKMLTQADWFTALRPILEKGGHIENGSIVRVPKFKYPLIVQKRDGGFTYDTTDMAAIWYRTQVLHADVIRVITDVGQAGHFELINSAAEQMGWLNGTDVEHVGFGLVTGIDGKRFRTRNTDVVKLTDLIDEAVTRCYDISMEKAKEKEGSSVTEGTNTRTSGLSEKEIQKNAEVLGIAAIKYHDLKQNRASNYSFSFDKMCDLEGNSALYLLYSYVRICGIMRKVGDAATFQQVTPQEIEALCAEYPAARTLAFQLTKLHASIDRALADNMPSRLTDYVYSLVCRFTDLYGKVCIKDSPAAMALCNVCARMIEKCLELLGIGVVERL